jgi:hypothetical protein
MIRMLSLEYGESGHLMGFRAFVCGGDPFRARGECIFEPDSGVTDGWLCILLLIGILERRSKQRRYSLGIQWISRGV